MQQGRALSPEVRARILQEFIDNPNAQYMEISRKYDCSRETVKNILYRAGYKLPGRRKGKGKSHTISTQERNELNGISPAPKIVLDKTLEQVDS